MKFYKVISYQVDSNFILALAHYLSISEELSVAETTSRTSQMLVPGFMMVFLVLLLRSKEPIWESLPAGDLVGETL